MDRPLQKTLRKRSAAYVPALFFLFLYVALFLVVLWYRAKVFAGINGSLIQSALRVPSVYIELFIVLSQIVAGIFLAAVCSRKNKALHFAGVGLFSTANILLLLHPAYIYGSTIARWGARRPFRDKVTTLLQFAALLCLLAAAVSAIVLTAVGSFSTKRAVTARKLWFVPGALCVLSALQIVLMCLPSLIEGTANGNTDSLTYVIMGLLLVIPTLDCGVYFCVCKCLSVAGATVDKLSNDPDQRPGEEEAPAAPNENA